MTANAHHWQARIVGEHVRQFIVWSLLTQPTIAVQGISPSPGMEEELGSLGLFRRPLILKAPGIVTHNEQSNGRLLIQLIAFAPQMLIQPQDLQCVNAATGIVTKIKAAHVLVPRHVIPRPNHQFLIAPGVLTARLHLQAGEVLDGPFQENVIPTGNVQRRQRDLVILAPYRPLFPVVVVGVVLEPVVIVRGQSLLADIKG
jgi:hypothetical protein